MNSLDLDVDVTVSDILSYVNGNRQEGERIMQDVEGNMNEYIKIPFAKRSREDDELIHFFSEVHSKLIRHFSHGGLLGNITEGCECDTYNHFIDIPLTEELITEPLHNYPQRTDIETGQVFNRRSVFLKIHWGKVKGTRVLRVAITRIGSRGEEDKTLLQFDMPAEPDENDNLKHPKQYVFQALKQAKRQFSDKVGCVICGKPDIWFKKIQTPLYPLYQVMFKELDFADPENRVCRECEKLVNRRQAEFNPVPELDDDGNKFNSIFTDSVSEPYTVRRDLQVDSQDFLAALDVHASNLQLGG